MNKVGSWFSKIFLAPIVKKLFIKEIKGKENIPKRNFILVSNHQSYLDIIIDAYLCVPRRFHFIGQVDGFKGIMKGLIRFLYFISGVIPLDRRNKESRKKVIREATEVLKKGDILIIYPEGRRSLNKEIQKGKLGVAGIFLKTGVPILPTGVKGTFELLPPKGKLKISQIVKINIGKLLYFEKEFAKAQNLNCDSEEYKEVLREIIDKIMGKITNLFEII